MVEKYEPCSICEEYIEGVACTKDQCPVAKMKAENERLEKRLEKEKHALFEQQAYTAKLQAEIERLTVNMNAFGLGMKREKERADTARAEAIKEFAEKLKLFAITKYDWSECVDIEDIDKLAKELTEEQNGNL